MNLVEIIKERKSIRKFIDQDVANYIIEDLIDAARFAPSAKNRQPWYFLVVKDNVKNKIADIMIKDLEKHKDYGNNSINATALVIKEAPILILVFRPKDDNWIVGDSLSIGAAIEHICLRATELGLGTLWIRDIVYTKDQIANILNMSHMDLISAISIGYYSESPLPKIKKKLNDILYWY